MSTMNFLLLISKLMARSSADIFEFGLRKDLSN
jgi:hypothetical protein